MQKIAIIGSAALFPGSSTKDAFWENLMQGKDLTSTANQGDFGVDPQHFFQKEKGIEDKCYSLRGGYIRDFHFNPQGYHLDADYLAKQDKLYQWSLFTANEALKDAGYRNKTEQLKNCGLILGNLSFPTSSSHRLLSEVYSDTLQKNLRELLGDQTIQLAQYKLSRPENEVIDKTPSGLVVEALGLKNSHYCLDAACATSLYAIKLACDELSTGKCDLMLAGAISASDQLFIHMGFSLFHAYAARGEKFVPFDKDSAGLVSSEGAGMVLLKRLDDAQRDGDNILGVIAGIGLSNDGRGKFLLSPNPKGQKLAFDRAYEGSNLKPSDTSYLECHATGTPLGDVTELNSIANYFKQHNCTPLLGSVKSNMGHLLTAAGMTGLQKVLLSIQNQVIPPNINLENPISADQAWEGSDKMITQATRWSNEFKQAGINSFGFGGTNAHMVVQSHYPNEEVSANTKTTLKPMSLIGMDAHFGSAKSLNEFYHCIYNGEQLFTELPKERWKGIENNSPLLESYGFKEGKAPHGAYIESFEIDLLRYKIQPKEAERLHPQQALLLKVADNAIKDAGLEEGSNVAVLVAMETELAIHQCLSRWDVTWQVKEALAANNIVLNAEQEAELITLCKSSVYHREGKPAPSEFTSFIGNLMASRVAALWDFSGACFTVSNGDQSVEKALEIAQNMLSEGSCDAVVVGAVDFAGGLENVLLRNKKHRANSNDKPSIPLNQNERGWLIGEGAGAVVLKASEDITSERTYVKIEGLDGESFDFNPSYIELHATGIEQADQAEKDALLKEVTAGEVALGSVKSNIGHTGAAQGMAALIKTALCLYHRFIPAVPNWNKAEDPAFEHTSYYFPIQSRPWIKRSEEIVRTAAIRGSGNKLIALSEMAMSRSEEKSYLRSCAPKLFPFGGENEETLRQDLEVFHQELAEFNDLAKLSSNCIRRFQAKKNKYNLALIANDLNSLRREINFFVNQLASAFATSKSINTPAGSYFSPNPLGAKGKVAFVYPGSATAYTGLAQDLYQLFPRLLTHYENLLEDIDQFAGSKYLYPNTKSIQEKAPNIYADTIAMMSAGVYYSVNFTKLLREGFKLQPEIAFGYSMGECSSMWYSLGVWHPDGARKFRDSPIFRKRFAGDLELLAEHWNVSSEEAKQRWVSLVLLSPKERVESLVRQKEQVYLTFTNTQNEVVISGDRSDCEAIAKQLNCPIIEIPFQNIIHQDFCANEKEGLIDMHHFELADRPNIDFYSSITQDIVPLESKAIAENSFRVCAQAVDFPSTVNKVYDAGARIFIEMGANSTCTNWIQKNLKGREHLAVAIDQKGKSDLQSLCALLAKLIAHGVSLDLSMLCEDPTKEKQSKQFMKKIVPGGTSIYARFENKELQQRFAEIRENKVNVKRAQPALAFADSAYDALTPSIWSEAPSNLGANNLDDLIKENSSIMHSDTIDSKPNKLQIERLGENGLRLQDFDSGEQFEGKEVVFSQEDLEEFANGKIGKVFGPEYDIIDTYRRRVMLPMDPYLLVSRVTKMNAKLGEYVPSTMTTEYDIPYNAWYSTDKQIPSAVCVESGQCDLLLISYLGIDLQNKGNLVYRLLDCTLTFVDDLPYEGQTLRYDISIDSFVRNADNLLFFFSYNCYVQDRLVLKMRGGCAGFFEDEQLEEGAGVVYSNGEIEKRKNAERKYFTPLLRTHKKTFSKKDLQFLIDGQPEKCFDDISYFANGRNPSLRIPPEKILMLDRITDVDLTGGAYGLGTIVAEKDLAPEDWYFPCHFRDDEVLAGSLQAEGGGNLLRFFMLLLGMQRLTKDARFQPLFDLPQKVRCRKQVTPRDTKLIYKLEVKEIGLIPHPFVIADLEIISDGVITVHFENLGLQLREKDNPKYLDQSDGFKVSPRSEGALMNEKDISTFALGNMTDCFGPEFAVYNGKKMSRQPNSDLQLISRILKVDGQRGDFSKPSTIYAEYDVPQDAWYYEQNSNKTMPYSMLMEIALQPCGLLGAYLGSTLQFSDQELFLRNLDGDGESFDLPTGTDFRGKTIANKSVLVSSIAHGGTILQRYTFELSIDGQVFYKGNSSFGFFTAAALAAQAGLDKGGEVPATFVTENYASSDLMRVKLDSLYGKMKLFKAPLEKPHYRLASDQLNLIDDLKIAKGKGNYDLGYVHALKQVKPYNWFFTCHFYQDPVMPGSLGVESILQAMQVFALQQDLGKEFKSPKFVQVRNHKTVWKYRGQILLSVKEMQLEAHIKSIEKVGNQLVILADAYLWNDKMRIYEVTDLALGIEEA